MHDDWGPHPPWYEDLFFAIAGIIIVCFGMVAIAIFAITIVAVIMAGAYYLLSLVGFVPL